MFVIFSTDPAVAISSPKLGVRSFMIPLLPLFVVLTREDVICVAIP